MIRVNLTQTKITSVGDYSAIGTTTESPGVNRSTLIVKILIILVPTILLLVYEHININRLESELKLASSESDRLSAELAEKQKQTAPMKEFEDKAKELEDKIKSMKKLSRLRLRTVKALDFMQSSLPDRMWFTDVKMTDDQITLRGLASTDDDLTRFMKSLENSVLFTNVLLVRSEVSKSAYGDYKEFEINCSAEVLE
jgi:type IV pilus assembly protein PilN